MRPYKILVVVSDRGIREELSCWLESQCLQTAAVTNGEHALKILERDEFDVAICEVFLPGLDGVELAKAITGRDRPPAVVLMSLYTTRSMAREAYHAGARAFLRMPISYEGLGKIIDRVSGKNLSFITPVERYDE